MWYESKMCSRSFVVVFISLPVRAQAQSSENTKKRRSRRASIIINLLRNLYKQHENPLLAQEAREDKELVREKKILISYVTMHFIIFLFPFNFENYYRRCFFWLRFLRRCLLFAGAAARYMHEPSTLCLPIDAALFFSTILIGDFPMHKLIKLLCYFNECKRSRCW